MRYKQFYCRACQHEFERNKFRIVKRADGVYYASYCPFCGELVYKKKEQYE